MSHKNASFDDKDIAALIRFKPQVWQRRREAKREVRSGEWEQGVLFHPHFLFPTPHSLFASLLIFIGPLAKGLWDSASGLPIVAQSGPVCAGSSSGQSSKPRKLDRFALRLLRSRFLLASRIRFRSYFCKRSIQSLLSWRRAQQKKSFPRKFLLTAE